MLKTALKNFCSNALHTRFNTRRKSVPPPPSRLRELLHGGRSRPSRWC